MQIKSRTKILFTLFLLYIALLTGCTQRKNVSLKDIDPLALTPDVEWAVVISPYVAFRSSPGFDNTVLNHGRRGDVIMVKGKKYLREESTDETDPKKPVVTVRYVTWYLFDSGWLEEEAVSIYDNRLRAETAAANLK